MAGGDEKEAANALEGEVRETEGLSGGATATEETRGRGRVGATSAEIEGTNTPDRRVDG